MSKDDRDLPEDFGADEFGAPLGDEEARAKFFERTRSALGPNAGRGAAGEPEPQESFDELLSDLSGKMVEGGLANRLRGVMKRGAAAGREALARGRAAVGGSADEASSNTSGSASAETGDAGVRALDEGASGDSRAKNAADSFEGDWQNEGQGGRDSQADGPQHDAAADDVSGSADVSGGGELPEGTSPGAQEPGVSKNTRDFMASLEERFPGVKSSMLPPPPPKDSVSEADSLVDEGDRAAKSPANPNLDDSRSHSETASSGADSDEDFAEEFAEPGEAKHTENVVSMSRKFISETAAKIAAASAAREQARRERREAREAEAREAEARALAAAEAEAAEVPVVEETGWGDPLESRASVMPEESAQTEPHRQSLAERMEGARASFDDEDATEVLAETSRPVQKQKLRRAGDTDNLEPLKTAFPSRMKFTRRGTVIKLSSGTKVLQNSMQSVRSTVNALNSGQSIDPTRPTIALFAALILGATIISSSTLLSTGTLSSRALWGFSPSETVVTEAPTEVVVEEETTPPAPAPGAPKIESIDVISYNADDGDHPEWAEYMFDGDQGSRWQSRYFAQPELPQDNRIKLIIHLEEESTVSSVTFYGPIDGGQVDLRVNDGADPFGSPVLTSSKMARTTTLKPTNPAVGTTVTLDFVALPIEDEGQYRVKIDELSLQ